MAPAWTWTWLGLVPYADALARQRALRDDVIAGRAPDTLLMMEHPPVVTLGKGAGAEELRTAPEALAARGIALHHVERGGKATYHGPGQLVGYPIVHVGGAGVGVARFVARMGEALAAWLRARGAEARFDLRCTGVFCPGGKIVSIGIHVSRGVALHGFAMNLARAVGDAAGGFATIVPCGDANARIATLEGEAGKAPAPAEAAPSVAEALREALGR